MARIVLLSAEWPARALVRAELEERGHDLIALDDPADLDALPVWPPIDLLIVDAAGLGAMPDQLRDLRARSHARRALLASSALDQPTLAAARAAFDRVIVRPFTVGDLARAAEELLARDRDEPGRD